MNVLQLNTAEQHLNIDIWLYQSGSKNKAEDRPLV